MSYQKLPYNSNLTLFTDLYQLTMGQVYWAEGMAEREAVFHHSFRTVPQGGGFVIAAGLETLVDYLKNFRFADADISFLATIPGNDGKPIFRQEYLQHLRNLEFSCDVDAVPEGTAVFPHEPLVRVKGNLLQAQLIETALLNLINFPTAIATTAARIAWAAGEAPVYDFGARRAPGVDGALTATRSAYIGGFAGTSNVWAAHVLGIPAKSVKGTMAHSLVMSFDSETQAFEAYAREMPNNSLFLVDTYGTIQGVRHAIEAGRRLRAAGFEMLGVRLDSGDLARLSKRARRMLDEAGFGDTTIVATNDLNELLIQSLRAQDARISVWGVGTKLMQPSLAGVYKLAAVRAPEGEWTPKIKLSDQPLKISIPGILQVRRFRTLNGNIADCIYDERNSFAQDAVMISMRDQTKQMRLPRDADFHDLLVAVMRGGRVVYEQPTLDEIRLHRMVELRRVSDATKRFDNPDEYRVGLEKSLYLQRENLIIERRGVSDWETEAA
ncbi:MAG TPA: nicotinate phosphoribosyltransferase [Pyrinomonadaceae bacterium]|nr:nicotinate phosphoribosyltransferase [Pyrinomonadaceae bacterium]